MNVADSSRWPSIPVAHFHAATMALLDDLGIGTQMWPVPVVLPTVDPTSCGRRTHTT